MNADALERAFRATVYRVETNEGCFDLRIDALNPAFDAFLHRQGVTCWGVVTACNPGGRQCPDSDNARNHSWLLEKVRASGWSFCPASNHADDGSWPVEPGVLLMQVSERDVCQLAAEFMQSACVYGEVGSVPHLCWIQGSS